MARPKKNNLEYFSHDNGMRNDRKIKALRAKFGLVGYAVYNMLLETLCESEMLVIKWDETEIELVSGDLTIVSGELTKIIDYLLLIGLLKRSNGYIFCEQLDKRSIEVFGKRTHDLDSLRKINGVILSETPVSVLKSTQSKVKESKVKESKVNESPPSLSDVVEYFQKNGYQKSVAERAWKGYDAAGWKDSKGKTVLNWKQKMVHVWFKDEHRIGNETPVRTINGQHENKPLSKAL
jgi:hypothetical protein